MSIAVEKELPKGWSSCKIEEVVDVIRGASPRPKGDPRYFGGEIPWIMISDISREKGKIITKTKDHVTVEGSKKSRFLKKGSLILSNSGTVCVPKILGVDGCIHDGFVTFPNIEKNLQVLFMYYLFEYIRPRIINENKQGITQVNLNTTIVKNIQFLLPPLNEQKRIVAKIEELFSLVDSAKDTLEKTKILLKQYRQSILKHAFEGKLTENLDPDLNNFSPKNFLNNIFQSRKKIYDDKCKLAEKSKLRKPKKPDNLTDLPLPSKYTLYKIPVHWDWCSLNSLSSQITDGEHNNPKYTERGNLLLSAKNIRDGFVAYDDVHYINDSDFQSALERCKPEKHDVLIVSVGATTGRSAIVKETIPFAVLRSVLLIKPEHINSFYVFRFLQSPMAKKWLNQASGSTAQAHLYIRDTKIFPFPLCSPNEQKVIVEKIEESFSLIDKNEILIDKLLLQYSQIKNSILKQAFEGKLVPQDPNDEPAEVLLQRIKEEKKK